MGAIYVVRRSLAWRLLGTIMLTTVAISIVTMIVAERFFWRDLRSEQLRGVASYISERAIRENAFFETIKAAHEDATDALNSRIALADPTLAADQFDRLFPPHGDGTRRSAGDLFDGYVDPQGDTHSGVGGLLNPGVRGAESDPVLMVAAYHTIDRAGEMLRGDLDNIYFFTPQNELIISASSRPDQLQFYRRDADSAFDLANVSFTQRVSIEENPDGRFICDALSQLIYVRDRESLTTGCFTPVEYAGARIGAFGTTIALRTYFTAAIEDVAYDADNVFIDGSGRLIAHRDLLTGTIDADTLETLSDQLDITEIHALIRADGRSTGVVLTENGGTLVAFAHLPGPDWFFVSLIDPGSLLSQARRQTGVIAIAALVGLILQAAVTLILLYRYVLTPLAALTVASFRPRDENRTPSPVLDAALADRNEIGTLARTLRRQKRLVLNLLSELETRVAERTRELERANDAKSDFLANVSHELRTPLNGILGLAQALEVSAQTDEQGAQAAMIRSSGETLSMLLNDVLDMSKIEAGKLDLAAVPTNPTGVFEDLTALFTGPAEQKGLRLTLKVDETLPETIEIDALRVKQCVTNLLSNAIKFTETGEVTIAVRAEAAREGQMRVIAEVSDSGIGMNAATLKRLFAPFEQADAATAIKFGGTGLGLSIARKLARLLGGDVTARSVPGQGSVFTLTFVGRPLEENIEDRPSTDARSLAERPEYAALIGLRILLVEDNFINRQVAKAFLQWLKPDLHEAENGEIGLQKLTDSEYDLVLMDVRMPVMDGLEAARRLRASDAVSRAVGIVALTANATPEDVLACAEAGMDTHLAKPIMPQALFDAMCEALTARAGSAGEP
jgi:signal transduction histidine kinase/ActR/RegA family two-component response regulator